MAIADRIIYALIGAIFGALVGVLCWWLYGLAHSLTYDGPGMDPVLRHWITYASWAFAATGFIFRQRVIGVISNTISAIFHFEIDIAPGERRSPVVGLVFLVIILAAIWYTVPVR